MNHYSFIKDELEDFTIVYEFATVHNIFYTVSFSNSEYINFLHSYPTLLNRGYGISIFRLGERKTDERVFATIVKVVSDFLSGENACAVLLYHCDTSDGKQAARDKLFNTWCSDKAVSDFLWKYSVRFEVPKKDGTSIDNYLGCVTIHQNPDLPQIQDEFQQLAVQLLDLNSADDFK